MEDAALLSGLHPSQQPSQPRDPAPAPRATGPGTSGRVTWSRAHHQGRGSQPPDIDSSGGLGAGRTQSGGSKLGPQLKGQAPLALGSGPDTFQEASLHSPGGGVWVLWSNRAPDCPAQGPSRSPAGQGHRCFLEILRGAASLPNGCNLIFGSVGVAPEAGVPAHCRGEVAGHPDSGRTMAQ